MHILIFLLFFFSFLHRRRAETHKRGHTSGKRKLTQVERIAHTLEEQHTQKLIIKQLSDIWAANQLCLIFAISQSSLKSFRSETWVVHLSSKASTTPTVLHWGHKGFTQLSRARRDNSAPMGWYTLLYKNKNKKEKKEKKQTPAVLVQN